MASSGRPMSASAARQCSQRPTPAPSYDKVIAYEKFIAPDGSWLDGDWPRRLMIAAANWDDPVTMAPTALAVPGDNQFHAGALVTVCKLKDTPASFDFQLIAAINDSDRRELAFRTTGGTTPGWYLARSATDHTPSKIDFSVAWLTFELSDPEPVDRPVHGTVAELNPRSYVLDTVAQDRSMADEEQLREQLRAELPGWNVVSRYYKDETDLRQRKPRPPLFST